MIEGFYAHKAKLFLEVGKFLSKYIRHKVKRLFKRTVNAIRFLNKMLRLFIRRHKFRRALKLRQSLSKCKTQIDSSKDIMKSVAKIFGQKKSILQNEDNLLKRGPRGGTYLEPLL